MKCKSNEYTKITIKDLFNSLEEVMLRNPNITLDSEVIISDLNMKEFMREFKIYPTFDYTDRKHKAGIYFKSTEKETVQVKEETVQAKEETVQADCTSKDLSWLNKYARR